MENCENTKNTSVFFYLIAISSYIFLLFHDSFQKFIIFFLTFHFLKKGFRLLYSFVFNYVIEQLLLFINSTGHNGHGKCFWFAV